MNPDAADPEEPEDELSREVAGFLTHLEVEVRASRHTVAAYRRDLLQLVEFLRDSFPDEVPAAKTVDRARLRRFLGQRARGAQASTMARKLSALRAFFSFLERRGTIDKSPASLLSGPKLPKKLPAMLNAETTGEVMETPDGVPQGERESCRDTAMLELLYGCGLRVSELIGLDLGDLRFSEGLVRVRGKGQKERLVPLGAKARQALEAYLPVRGDFRALESGYLDTKALLLRRGGRRVGERQVQNLVRRYGTLGAGRADLHPHALRHACATHMLEGGADLRAIQEILGHSSLAVTQRYTHLTVEKLMAVYDQAHPMAHAPPAAGDPTASVPRNRRG